MILANEISTFCTMRENTSFVSIPKGKSFKAPSLKETCDAYNIDFDSSNAHASDYDTLKCFEVYVKTIG